MGRISSRARLASSGRAQREDPPRRAGTPAPSNPRTLKPPNSQIVEPSNPRALKPPNPQTPELSKPQTLKAPNPKTPEPSNPPSLTPQPDTRNPKPRSESSLLTTAGPNPFNHRDDHSRPALNHGSLHSRPLTPPPLDASAWHPKPETSKRGRCLIAQQPAPAPHLAHPEGYAALRIVLITLPCVSRSCEHVPDGFDLHL